MFDNVNTVFEQLFYIFMLQVYHVSVPTDIDILTKYFENYIHFAQ